MDIKAPNLNFEIKIDNEKINYTYKDYYCRVELDNVTPGYHDVSVSYEGDELFARNTFEQTIEMSVRPSYDYFLKQNETGYFNLTLPQDTEGTLTVEIESEEYDYKIRENITVNGGICLKLPSEHIGYYTLKTHFDGNYEINDIKMSYYVEPWGRIYITHYRPFINDPIYMILTLPKDAVGNLTVNIKIDNDENYTRTITKEIANGEVKIKLPTENNVTYLVDGYFEGNYEIHNLESSYHVYFLELTAKDIEMYYCDGTSFKINVKSEIYYWELAGFEITVKIGSNKYITYLEDGNAKIKLKELPGKYTITTTFGFTSMTMKNMLYIKPILTLKKVKIKKSSKKLVLTAKLAKKLKGKKITFKFNNKKYTAKTNSKGIAKVTIKKSVLKKLKVGKKLTYSATYIKSKVKKTVKISK